MRVPGSQGAYDKNEELEMELDRSKSAWLEPVGIQMAAYLQGETVRS